MSSENVYKRKFEELLGIEEKAMYYYKLYLDKVEDLFLLERIKELYNDELRHMEIVQGFLGRFK